MEGKTVIVAKIIINYQFCLLFVIWNFLLKNIYDIYYIFVLLSFLSSMRDQTSVRQILVIIALLLLHFTFHDDEHERRYDNALTCTLFLPIPRSFVNTRDFTRRKRNRLASKWNELEETRVNEWPNDRKKSKRKKEK